MKYLIALTLVLVGTSSYADFYVINGGTGLFDTSLGTLNKVTVRFKKDNVLLESSGAHTHSITSTTVGYSVAGTTASLGFEIVRADGQADVSTTISGLHQESVTVPGFLWNNKTISLTPTPVLSSSSGGHSHQVTGLSLSIPPGPGLSGTASITGGTVVAAGAHTQTFSFDRSIEFSGADLDIFLGAIAPTSNYSTTFTVNSSTQHSHLISSGVYVARAPSSIPGGPDEEFLVTLTSNISLSNTSDGSHTVNLSGEVFETTFEYTPFSAIPEPSSFILFSVVAGAGAVGRRFWRKRKTA